MSRARVLWISSAFPPQVGGLQRYCDAVTRELAERADLTLVTAEGQRPAARAAHVQYRHLAGCATEAQFAALGEGLRGVVASVRPDLIHLGHAQMAALRPFLPPTVPVVATLHGNDLTSPWIKFGNRDMVTAIRAGLAGCHLVCVSNHTAGLAREHLPGATISVVHNNCDLERFRRVHFDRTAFLERLGVPTDVPLVVSVARLQPRKAHMLVMRALAELDVPFHWLVIGEGGQRRRLELARLFYRLRRKVSMPGSLSEDDVLLGYNAAHVFVLTPIVRMLRGEIDSEGFGIVYHEAGACGVPAIASDTSGCAEAVLHERTGLLVPPGDLVALRGALRRLLTDEPLRLKLGAAAEAHVRAQGGWPAVARRLLDIYTIVLGGDGMPAAHGIVSVHG